MVGILLAALIATLAHPEPGAGGRAGARDRHAAVRGRRGGGRSSVALPGATGFRIMWLDLAGSLTFIGVVISVLIEPDQMVRLFTLSDQPE